MQISCINLYLNIIKKVTGFLAFETIEMVAPLL